ncbi:MAG: PAS domain S-box protein, partial [Planctomycetota bacterium]|nr:PAS domain S-box protein [Planctomycetota bacterium]
MRRFTDEIVLGTAFLLLILAAGGALFWRAEEQERRRECEAALWQWAQDKAEELRRWRQERLGDAQVLAANPFLTAAIADFVQRPQEEKQQHLLDFFASFTAYGYSDVVLVAPNGRILLSLAKTHEHPHMPARSIYEETLRRGAPQVALVDWHSDPQGKISPHLSAMATICLPGKDTIAGFIFLVIEIEHLKAILAAHRGSRQTIDIHLVRREGEHAVFISDLAHQNCEALQHRVPLSKKESTAVMAVEGRTGVMRGVNERGAAVLSAILPVPDSPWFLICQQDEAEALALHRRQPGLILIAVASLLAAGVALAGMLVQRRQKRLAIARAEAAQAAQQAQAERLRLAEQSRAILMSIGDAVIVADPEGRVATMNHVAEALTGWPLAEAAGRPLSEVFRIINEETRQCVESPVARVLHEGVVVGLANHTLLIRRDGSEWPIADSGAPVRGADGNIQGVVLVFRDQSKERAAEQALRASEERLRLLVERMSSAVAVYQAVDEGRDFRFVDINP